MNAHSEGRRQSGAVVAGPVLAVLIVLSVLAVLAGCSASSGVGRQPGASSPTFHPTSPPTSPTTDSAAGPVRIELRFEEGVATATLADTSAARDFAAMLPLDLDLRDPMGQAKSGELPGPIAVGGAGAVSDPQVGQLYYWPPARTFAIYHDDLGQSVPPPGLVRLGAVDTGMSAIGAAGHHLRVRVDLLDRTGA